MRTLGRRSLLFATFLYVSAAFAGDPVTVTGEVVETYCWAVHEVGGTGHAQCGIECAKRGLPIALYDSKSRSAMILLPSRDKASLPADLVNAMGQRITIKGEVVARGGIKFLIVQSWRK